VTIVEEFLAVYCIVGFIMSHVEIYRLVRDTPDDFPDDMEWFEWVFAAAVVAAIWPIVVIGWFMELRE
jgi:hypothetical protein